MLLTTREVCELFNFSRQTLHRLRVDSASHFPTPVRLPGGELRYLKYQLLVWIAWLNYREKQRQIGVPESGLANPPDFTQEMPNVEQVQRALARQGELVAANN